MNLPLLSNLKYVQYFGDVLTSSFLTTLPVELIKKVANTIYTVPKKSSKGPAHKKKIVGSETIRKSSRIPNDVICEIISERIFNWKVWKTLNSCIPA